MYQIFERLLEQKGVSTSDVSKATNIPKSTLSSWKSGISTPKADKLYAIAKYFDVPMEVFFADDADQILARNYEKLNDQYGKVEFKGFSPVFDVAAGEGRINGDYSDEYIDEGCASEEESWVQVHGDSMYPVLQDGDYVKVHHQTETAPGDMTVVKVDGERATVKYVEIADNGVWLKAENKDVFEDRFFTVAEVMTMPVTIVGKVVELRRRY